MTSQRLLWTLLIGVFRLHARPESFRTGNHGAGGGEPARLDPFNRMQLSTCRFGIKDNRITCAERPRIKSLESVGKNYGEDGKDTKNVTIVQEPAAGVASESLFLLRRHAARLPGFTSALGRVKRIASGNSDDDAELASVFGSEFTTEDTDTGKLEEYEINVLEETTESGREVWKIELIPNAERARKSRYSRTVNMWTKSVLSCCESKCLISTTMKSNDCWHR